MTTAPRKTVSKTEFNAVKHRLAELTAMIEVLKRKSKGATKANAQVAKLEAQIKTIKAELKLAADRYSTPNIDPAIKASAAVGIWALDSRVTELYNDLDGRITTLEGTVGEHTGLLAEYGTSIGMLNEGQQSLHSRVSSISTMESARMPWWQVVVALIAGIIGAIMWNNRSFGDSFTLPDGQVANVPYGPANSGWTALIAGILVAAAVSLILSFFTSGKKTEQVNTTTTNERNKVTTAPVVARPVPVRTSIRRTVSPREPIADPAPTKVITTEPGAPTGARS